MSACVLLNLLNKLRKRGLSSILSNLQYYCASRFNVTPDYSLMVILFEKEITEMN